MKTIYFQILILILINIYNKMTIILSLNTVDLFIRLNNISVNNSDLYNDKINKLKTAGFLLKDDDYYESNQDVSELKNEHNTKCSSCDSDSDCDCDCDCDSDSDDDSDSDSDSDDDSDSDSDDDSDSDSDDDSDSDSDSDDDSDSDSDDDSDSDSSDC
jgi:hypothetical protein